MKILRESKCRCQHTHTHTQTRTHTHTHHGGRPSGLGGGLMSGPLHVALGCGPGGLRVGEGPAAGNGDGTLGQWQSVNKARGRGASCSGGHGPRGPGTAGSPGSKLCGSESGTGTAAAGPAHDPGPGGQRGTRLVPRVPKLRNTGRNQEPGIRFSPALWKAPRFQYS